MENKIFYRRNLPHYQPNEAVFFITFRLANSLPVSVIENLKNEYEIFLNQIKNIKNKTEQNKKIYVYQKKYFGKFDKLLDGSLHGPLWLKENKIASITADSIHYYDGNKYNLHAYCIMPNHVHMLFQVNPNTTARNEVSSYITSQNRVSGYIVTEILQNLKKYSSKESNKILKRTGQFWHHESYDHVVRSEIEFERIVNYIAQNPVKAHLVNNWKEWKWSYCKPDFISFIND